jgi:hypothetical protein
MKFSPGDPPIPEAYFSFSLHLAPSAAAVLLSQTGQFADALAGGDGFDVRNLFQYIKAGHSAPARNYSPQPLEDRDGQSALAARRLSALLAIREFTRRMMAF